MGTSIISGSPTGTTDVVNTSVNKISSKEFQADKNGILECTKKNIKNLVGSCLMAWALITWGTSARAEAPQNPIALLQASGFSGPSAEWVLALSNFVREKQASGGLAPTEAVSITTVVPLSPDGKGLDQLVNTGSKLPKKTFAEVADTSTLTSENYATVVEKLFDPADIDIWLTKPDGSPMSAQEKADYKESLEATKKRWLAKLPEFSTAGKQEIINRWFTLFNALATNPVHGSREEYRRWLIAANSIANYSSISPDKQKIFAPATVTQAAEYVLMTDPRTQMVKIERSFNEPWKPVFTLKYLVASDESLKKIGFTEGTQATQVALQGWNQDQSKIYESYSKIAAADSKIAAADSKIAAAEARIVLSDKRIAGYEEKNTFLKKFNILSDRFNIISAIIMKQLDEFPNKRTDHTFIESLSKNLQELKILKWELDIIAKEDAEKKYIPDRWKETIGILYATIVDTAKLKRAPTQNI